MFPEGGGRMAIKKGGGGWHKRTLSPTSMKEPARFWVQHTDSEQGSLHGGEKYGHKKRTRAKGVVHTFETQCGVPFVVAV